MIGLTDGKAFAAVAAAIATAVAGVLVAAGLPLSQNLTDAIITLITVTVPVVVLVIGWLHHNAAKVRAAALATNAPGATPSQLTAAHKVT